MDKNSFLMVGERHLKCQIEQMSWSPTRDLLALASDTGELMLHRLSSLEKVWTLPAADNGTLINAICWRPDGSALAVSYNSKESGIRFVYAEKAHIIWHLSEERSLLKNPVALMKWFEVDENNNDLKSCKISPLSCKDYITELPNLNSKPSSSSDIKGIIGNSRFHILLCCDNFNTITLFAYGVFPLAKITIDATAAPTDLKVIDLSISKDFKFISAFVDGTPKSYISLFNISSLVEDIGFCEQLTEKVCHLSSTLIYIEDVLDSINESCETVVQEMESKLTNYLSNKNISGSIGDEFMHFLMWGKTSDVLEELFTNCMTEKGVVKLGSLVEASYISIQQLLLVNLQLATDSIYFHLNEIKGMSIPTLLKGNPFFKQDDVCDVTNSVGSFILKASEMQQVIGESLQNFKAFFRWLYSSLLKMYGEPMDETAQMSIKELEFVTDFIMDSFIHEPEHSKTSGREKHFNLDKVYQYLQDSPLTSVQSLNENEWFRLVESTPSLANNPLILKRRANMSLRQLYNEFKHKMTKLLNCSNATVTKVTSQSCIMTSQLQVKHSCCQWFQNPENKEETRYFCTIVSMTTSPSNELILSKTPINKNSSISMRIKFSSDVVHFTYYNSTHITMILKENSYYLVQVSLQQLLKELNEHGSDGDIMTSYVCDATQYVTHRCSLDPMKAIKVSTSGTRKVSCLLDADLKHIKAFEMDDVDDDDDIDDSMTT